MRSIFDPAGVATGRPSHGVRVRIGPCLRCQQCGSPLPQSHDGERMWVTAGLMDDDLDAVVAYRIFAGSRADWDHEAESVAEFEEMPPA